jgi:hypothetical protein
MVHLAGMEEMKNSYYWSEKCKGTWSAGRPRHTCEEGIKFNLKE